MGIFKRFANYLGSRNGQEGVLRSISEFKMMFFTSLKFENKMCLFEIYGPSAPYLHRELAVRSWLLLVKVLS